MTETPRPSGFPPVKLRGRAARDESRRGDADGRDSGAADDRAAQAVIGDFEMAGPRAVYALTRRHRNEFSTPVFAGAQGDGLVIFTTRDRAALYLRTNRWDDYRPVDLSPFDLQPWLQQARAEGITTLLVDPNWHTQERGALQPGLSLGQLRDFSGEGLYDEIRALGNP